MRRTIIVAGTMLQLSLSLIRAASATPLTGAIPLSNQDIDARLEYATQALQSQKANADYWEYGWGAFDSGTMAWSALQASHSHNRKDRNTDIVQAGESLIGLADVVFRPLPAFQADSCIHPMDTQQGREQCLAEAERMLERSADRARDPYKLLPHLGNAGFNLLAGLIVWRLGGTNRALRTGISGEIIGELQLWTMPRQPIEDFDHYRITFSPLLIQTGHAQNAATGFMLSYRF